MGFSRRTAATTAIEFNVVDNDGIEFGGYDGDFDASRHRSLRFA